MQDTASLCPSKEEITFSLAISNVFIVPSSLAVRSFEESSVKDIDLRSL